MTRRMKMPEVESEMDSDQREFIVMLRGSPKSTQEAYVYAIYTETIHG